MIFSAFLVPTAFSLFRLANAVSNGLAITPPMGWVCVSKLGYGEMPISDMLSRTTGTL